MSNLNRRLKKAGKSLNIDKEEKVIRIVDFSDGPLLPDDSHCQTGIASEVDWPVAPTRVGRRGGGQQKSYSVSADIHILKWRYVKDGDTSSGRL